MKVLLSSRGSRGDVNPIIEIATAFYRRGDNVALCVPALFNDFVRGRGIEPALYTEDSTLVMKELGSGLRAIRTALDWFSRSVDEQFEFMLAESKDADVMVTSVNEVAAPTVAEYRGIPHVRIAYTPVLPGYHPPPLVPWQRLPAHVNRALWGMINLGAGLFVKGFIKQWRKKLGLAPVHSINQYFTGKSHTIMTLDPRLAPPCRSWEGRYTYYYSGYCYGDINGDIPQDVRDFIESGPPPVYIGFGSVSLKDAERFTDMVREAVPAAGCRVVLGTGWTGLGKSPLPDSIIRVGDTNHASLFPLMAGVAHHGGSGTTHTAARAGAPQFIMPQIADQYYWGHRVHTLGLGPRPVRPEKLTVKRLTDALSQLTQNADFKKNAETLAESMKNADGIPRVLEIISGICEGNVSEARGNRAPLSAGMR